MSDRGSNPFWRWSLAAYEREGVAKRLVYLQDAFGFDVNLALWCCWRAAAGETLDKDAIRKADDACAVWRDGVIEPLREARRSAKEGSPALYARIREAELAAEQIEQDTLFALSCPSSPAAPENTTAAANNNLALYASFLDAPRREGYASALLRDLIDHIFAPE